MQTLQDMQAAVAALENELKTLRETVPARVADLIDWRALPEAAELLRTLERIEKALERRKP